MELKIETITPEIAASYLSTSLGNRPISQRHVKRYAEEMTNGKWQLNGVSIIIDDNGHLIDGHHRLNAVVRAGIPVQMSVCRGVENSAFTTIDCGLLRSAAHILAMQGVPNWCAMSSIITASRQIERIGKITRDTTSKGSNADILEAYNNDKDGYTKSTQFAMACYKRANIIITSWIGGIHYYLTHTGGYGQYYVEEFFYELCNLDSSENEMIESLRKRIIREKVAGKKFNESLLFALICKCWNLYVAGNKTKKVVFTDSEQYPKFTIRKNRPF